MSQKYQRMVGTLAPGIYKLESGGFRVRVAIGHGKRGRRQRDTTFPKGTALRKMKEWQTQQRAKLLRLRIVPATGTLEADIPRYLDTLERTPGLQSDRTYQLEAWKDRFRARRRHTIARQEVQQLVTEWEQNNVAATPFGIG